MNLANAKQKFREKAIWFPHISSNDGERLSYSIAGYEFTCAEYELTRLNRMAMAEGVNVAGATLAIITDSKEAINFMPDDKVRYNGHDYNVMYCSKVKNYSTPKSVAYVIGLN